MATVSRLFSRVFQRRTFATTSSASLSDAMLAEEKHAEGVYGYLVVQMVRNGGEFVWEVHVILDFILLYLVLEQEPLELGS